MTIKEIETNIINLSEQSKKLAMSINALTKKVEGRVNNTDSIVGANNADLSALDDDIADSLLALAESISDMSILIEEVNTNESDV